MAKKIALTFDDAPLGDGSLFTGVERTDLLVDALADKGAQATFFVAPKDFDQINSFDRVSAYNNAGHLIASHTNTHPAASEVSPDIYFSDLDKAVDLVDDFSNYRPWFRFPYLDEGNTHELRQTYLNGLEARDLDNGYVTVDTFDWYMQERLDQLVFSGKDYDLDGFRDAYVEMIVDSANHYEAIGQDALGRSPAQLLLLHENDLAAMFIDDAIEALRADGWEIISADEAYKDPIADIVPDTLATGGGRLAALALDKGASYSILSHEGNTKAGINDLIGKHGALDSQTISGTPDDDYLAGTAGNDRFISLSGEDTVRASGGNDSIRLGDGYDQVDYDGAASDYVMSRGADGWITVSKPDGSTDKLSGVDGFWFLGEQKWYAATDIVTASVVSGITTGDDYILATSGDDQIISPDGSDAVLGSAGNDTINLGDDYDQIDYEGAASDYQMTRNVDGSITVLKPGNQTDTLTGVDGFWFKGEEKWYSADDLAKPTSVSGITEGNDIIPGTDGDDSIAGLGGEDVVIGSRGNDTISLGDDYDQIDYAGSAADYSMTRNADGSVTVIKPDGGTDTLTGVDGFWFTGEEKWYDVSDLAKSGSVIGITAGNDYIIATDGDDVIESQDGEDVVLGSSGSDFIRLGDGYDQMDYQGSAADYTVVRNDDGTVSVSKPDGGVDTLDGVDGLWFISEGKWYDIDDTVIEPAPEAGMASAFGLDDLIV